MVSRKQPTDDWSQEKDETHHHPVGTHASVRCDSVHDVCGRKIWFGWIVEMVDAGGFEPPAS